MAVSQELLTNIELCSATHRRNIRLFLIFGIEYDLGYYSKLRGEHYLRGYVFMKLKKLAVCIVGGIMVLGIMFAALFLSEGKLPSANIVYSQTMSTLSQGIDFGIRDNGRLYHEDLNVLHGLVFDEVRSVSLEFTNVLSLDVTAFTDTNVNITVGGDKLIIRYYEWLQNQYSIYLEDGVLTLHGFNFPDHKIPAGFAGSWGITQSDMFLMNWLDRHLNAQGKTLAHTIEITIPNTMTFDDVQISTFGNGRVMFNELRTIENNIGAAIPQIDNSISEVWVEPPYCDDLSILHSLIFDEARVVVHEFDNVLILDMSLLPSTVNINVTTGGNSLIIRYYEYVDKQFTLQNINDKLTISMDDVPYYKFARSMAEEHDLFRGTISGWTTSYGVFGWFSREWLGEYLQYMDKQLTINIILPDTIRVVY